MEEPSESDLGKICNCLIKKSNILYNNYRSKDFISSIDSCCIASPGIDDVNCFCISNKICYIALPYCHALLITSDSIRQDKRQDNFILIRLHRVQYGENINKIDSQSVFCSGS